MFLSFLGLNLSGLRRRRLLLVVFYHFFRKLLFLFQKFFLLIFFTFFLLITESSYPYFKEIKDYSILASSTIIQWISEPFLRIKDFFKIKEVFEKELETLRRENYKLAEWKIKAIEEQKKNRALKKLLNVVEKERNTLKTLKVLSVPSGANRATMLVAVPKDLFLEMGSLVLGPDGIIGRIIERSGNTARVLLITDSFSKIPAMIKSTKEQVIISGNPSHQLIVSHYEKNINSSIQPKIGDEIIYSDLYENGRCPEGFKIGRISAISEEQMVITPACDIKNLRYVIAILSS